MRILSVRGERLTWYDGGWIYMPDSSNPFEDPVPENPPRPCTHNWQRYEGFTEVYDYCTLCDEKRVP